MNRPEHELEQALVTLLQSKEKPALSALGDPASLRDASDVLGASPLFPEFLRLSLDALESIGEPERSVVVDFIGRGVQKATSPSVLPEVVSLLDAARPLLGGAEEVIFEWFLSFSPDRSKDPLARAAALDGALRWATSLRLRQLMFLTSLLKLRDDDDPLFLVRVAKVMGVAYTHWREAMLVERLSALAKVPGVEDEASFELGMAKLHEGLDAETRPRATECFVAARFWFSAASRTREQRPDAYAFIRCLDVLDAFGRGSSDTDLERLSSDLARDAFQITRWHSSEGDPPWLGARRAEAALFNSLALRLRRLALHLEETSWWEPAVVIEQYLLAAYTASRSILQRTRTGGIEALVRPQLEAGLARRDAQAFLLKSWVQKNPEHLLGHEASALSKAVDEWVRRGVPGPPPEAATGESTVAALLECAGLSAKGRTAAARAMVSALKLHLANLSGAELQVLEECCNQVAECPDYQGGGAQLFESVLTWTLRFLHGRLELTQKDDPGVSYLFERKDGRLPREGELQADYYRFLQAVAPGTEVEVHNVGGGRADVRVSLRAERLVVEIKREQRDSSFAALEQSYGSQTTDYQNVSIRLGVLLVLDQTELLVGGTPHLTSLVRATALVRKGESEPRWVVIVKVPGRRLRPSDLTKVAKSSGAKKRTKKPGSKAARPPSRRVTPTRKKRSRGGSRGNS